MSHYQPSVSLHQQDGGLSMADFAAQQGLAVAVLRYYVRIGRVIGARQDPRSKKWTIYPPAKLVDKAGDAMKPREPAAARGKLPPPAGVACAPPAGFSTGSVEVVDVGTSQHGLSADVSLLERETREGIHYLRLDAQEFAQLYAALDNDRSRVRKLVGKGVLPVGLLRCSDSVWQKMQAMSREGRLL